MIRVQRSGTAFPSVYNTLNQPNTTYQPVRATKRIRVGIRPLPDRPSTDFGNRRQSLVVVPDRNRDKYGTSMGATLQEQAAAGALRPAELGYDAEPDELFRAPLPKGASGRLGQANLIHLIRDNIRATRAASGSSEGIQWQDAIEGAPESIEEQSSLAARAARAAGVAGIAGARLTARAARAAAAAGIDVSGRAFREAYMPEEEPVRQEAEPEWQDIEPEWQDIIPVPPPLPPNLGPSRRSKLEEDIKAVKLAKPRLANQAVSGMMESEAKMEEPESEEEPEYQPKTYIIKQKLPEVEDPYWMESKEEESPMEDPFEFETAGKAKKLPPMEEPEMQNKYRYAIRNVSSSSSTLTLIDTVDGSTFEYNPNSKIKLSEIDYNIEDPLSKYYVKKVLKKNPNLIKRRVETYLINQGKLKK